MKDLEPLFPFAVLGVPVGLVTAEVPMGFVVVQLKVCVQLFDPDAMVQVEDVGVRVPVVLTFVSEHATIFPP